MKTPMMVLVLIMALLFGCKKAEITRPPAYDPTDFSVPAAAFTDPAIGLSVNRANKVVYVGEEFELKVSLYNMPDSVFGRSMELHFPAQIVPEMIIANQASVGTADSTISLQYISGGTVAFSTVYMKGTRPHVPVQSVMFKVVCKAVATGNPLAISTATADFRATRKNTAIGPNSLNLRLSVEAPALTVISSDEF